MTVTPTNSDRAQLAKQAITSYMSDRFRGVHLESMPRDELEYAVSDLICDLLHFAIQYDFDTGITIRRGLGKFGYELLQDSLEGVEQ